MRIPLLLDRRSLLTFPIPVWFLCALALGISSGVAAQPATFDEGMALFNQHRWSEAASVFEKVEARQPGRTDALLYLGKSLINMNRFLEADAALSKYVAAHARSDDAISLLAFCRFREDKPRDSLRLFTRAAAIQTPEADDFKIVALDYALLGDYRDAAKYLLIALQLQPRNIEARYHLGRIRFQQSRYDDAIAAFSEVLKEDPKNVKAENNLGLCFEAKGEINQALLAYQQAIKLDRGENRPSAQPYLNLGRLLTQMGKPEQALPSLLKGEQINPQLPEIHYELAKAYVRLGKLHDSEAELKTAIRLRPNYSAAHYELGMVYRQLGQDDLASAELRKVGAQFWKSQ